ncbi:NADH:ubiquinone oxidoreductase subunit F (NADH-binding) [Streptomyces sp. 2333.5]|uniref:NADH-ubiquinone oxidoreductase-F iron-sulfur binding region domain-containing protein n=1 Tax=unclassified Streptomyces TaxID=2593676 RepID=UPI00089CA32A|nr:MULTISPECIES: NADH-ubiquinone oxidoreductase-F iron-sulfur binding region domain-containing protein [unclassified Streptomyces]PJJ06299.1 NADH:ubiquinone oxidoreductase subunit F (NADH-binding) [Streptomyces sp. 2333.5]SEE93487.1 NADH:ubiquinone oxidoreductase, NADH-binding subunit (chain F) [Streptomyces sp. 2314.4]SEF08675.1 NADH:ubiquinone oxidoreductase, NADH-binding subunit (chain F) [Streptomyces sp. 2112.2]
MTRIDSLIPRGTLGVLGAAPGVSEDAEAYDAAGGYRATTAAAELLAGIDAAGLRGRGGAGYLTAAKLRAVRDAGGRPVVVANGEEGEPGSVKDRWLLRARPHLVLDGLLRAAEITGARRGYVYLSDTAAGERVRRALAERPPRLPVEVVETRHAYVAGEESAVVRRINGGPALPTTTPPRPHEEGIDGAPTLVANVETLARVALIAARPEGRRHTARSTLVTLAGGGADPLLAEVPYGCTLRTLARAQGTPEPAGVLMDGLFGGLIGPHFLDLALGPDTLAAAGTALGCGAIRFLAPEECPVSLASAAIAHLAAESVRQCGSCVPGTGSIRDDVGSLTTGTAAPGLVSRLHRRATAPPGHGACGLLDAAARTAGSLLRAFPHLVRSHLNDPCPACAAPVGPLTVAVPRVAGRPVPHPRSAACPG